jgi:FkbM family methyltransferase
MRQFSNAARPILDKFAPSLGRYYRWARDRRWMAAPKRTSYGFWLSAPPRFADAEWEASERRIFERQLEFVSICIDVGANVGVYSCIARSRGIHVLSIEPLRQNLRFLYANLLRNGFDDVEVFPLGLSDKPSLGNISGFGDVASFVKDWSEASSAQSETAPLSTLDILLGDRFYGQRMLIKIDVEGLEFEVLKGSSQVLKRSPKPIWLVEIILKSPLTGRTNEKFYETFRIFFDHGYSAYHLGEGYSELTMAVVAEFVPGEVTANSNSFNFLFSDRSIMSGP